MSVHQTCCRRRVVLDAARSLLDGGGRAAVPEALLRAPAHADSGHRHRHLRGHRLPPRASHRHRGEQTAVF